MKLFIKLLFIMLLTNTQISAQEERCGTNLYTDLLIQKYPEYAREKAKVNSQTQKWLNQHSNYTPKAIITIPVVVHVVWNTNQENISDAQIFSQIDILNADYRRTNADAINTPIVWNSVAADCEIEFCLATIDPNGAATTGITRTQTSQTSFSIQNDGMKHSSSGGIDAWPNEYYLNIWVCDLGGGLLGYATPPSNFLSNEDGVVIGYRYFGSTGTAQPPYHRGRTTTHEVGHWLNLEHVWGGWGSCGNDNVSDTPTQEDENYSCPSFPESPNSCGTTNANGDMFMNYMDYTNDACMNLFTNGQKARMISAINQYRPHLLNHNLCTGSAPNPSWECINGGCVDPGNGNGTYSNYSTCVANCACVSFLPPINEGFQSNNLPNSWSIMNNDGNTTWEITNTTGYNSNSCIYINNADYAANGEYDDLILPVLDLTILNSGYLTFDYAYCLWTDPNAAQIWSDTLQVIISNDCGNSWQKLWEKAGAALVTTTPIFNAFSWTPNNINDWKSEIINLSNYINDDDVVIKFRNVNQYENNLFLDNINIGNSTTNINNISLSNKRLIKITDILGREVINKTKHTPLFYIYDDGSVDKILLWE